MESDLMQKIKKVEKRIEEHARKVEEYLKRTK